MVLTGYKVWPEAGGILDQDPLFLIRFGTYTKYKNVEEKRKKAEQDRKSKVRKK